MITNFFLHLIQYLILIAVTAFLLYGVFRVWVDIVTTFRLNRFLKENMDVLNRILTNADEILYNLHLPLHLTNEGVLSGINSEEVEEGDLDD